MQQKASPDAVPGQPVVRELSEPDLRSRARFPRRLRDLGAPDAETFWSDLDYVHGRHHAPHTAAFGATIDGRLVGSNFATRWGSVGFFGPLSVHPDLQEQKIAQILLARTMEQFDAWGTRHAGLFTFAQSAKHVGLYQKFGFYARFLTAIMSKPARAQAAAGWSQFSALNETQKEEALRSCRGAAETLYPGLDLTQEIRTTEAQALGDTVLVEGSKGVAAFAVCHYGPRSEAGAGVCFANFGAVRDGPAAGQDFSQLIDACEGLAVAVGMPNVLAGVNMARSEAYQQLVARGYRTAIQEVAMHQNNDPASTLLTTGGRSLVEIASCGSRHALSAWLDRPGRAEEATVPPPDKALSPTCYGPLIWPCYFPLI